MDGTTVDKLFTVTHTLLGRDTRSIRKRHKLKTTRKKLSNKKTNMPVVILGLGYVGQARMLCVGRTLMILCLASYLTGFFSSEWVCRLSDTSDHLHDKAGHEELIRFGPEIFATSSDDLYCFGVWTACDYTGNCTAVTEKVKVRLLYVFVIRGLATWALIGYGTAVVMDVASRISLLMCIAVNRVVEFCVATSAVFHYLALLHFTGQMKNGNPMAHSTRDQAGWGLVVVVISLILAVLSVLIMSVFRMPPGNYPHRHVWKLPSTLRPRPYLDIANTAVLKAKAKARATSKTATAAKRVVSGKTTANELRSPKSVPNQGKECIVDYITDVSAFNPRPHRPVINETGLLNLRPFPVVTDSSSLNHRSYTVTKTSVDKHADTSSVNPPPKPATGTMVGDFAETGSLNPRQTNQNRNNRVAKPIDSRHKIPIIEDITETRSVKSHPSAAHETIVKDINTNTNGPCKDAAAAAIVASDTIPAPTTAAPTAAGANPAGPCRGVHEDFWRIASPGIKKVVGREYLLEKVPALSLQQGAGANTESGGIAKPKATALVTGSDDKLESVLKHPTAFKRRSVSERERYDGSRTSVAMEPREATCKY